jgi:hypothetical protein
VWWRPTLSAGGFFCLAWEAVLYLKCSKRRKNGKEHRRWSIVENRRVQGGECVQRHLLYLGEIKDSQQAAVAKEHRGSGGGRARAAASRALSRGSGRRGEHGAADPAQALGADAAPAAAVGCLLAGAGTVARAGARRVLARTADRESQGNALGSWCSRPWPVYRWLSPGSEWRLHREWFERSALGDLLGGDYRLAADDTLYRCHDRWLVYKAALFTHLQDRWRDLFNAKFDVLLYDLTSTCFESDPPESKDGRRRFGDSRDQRADCVQVGSPTLRPPLSLPPPR